nr:unnamed protein product [Digitaria exilis]
MAGPETLTFWKHARRDTSIPLGFQTLTARRKTMRKSVIRTRKETSLNLQHTIDTLMPWRCHTWAQACSAVIIPAAVTFWDGRSLYVFNWLTAIVCHFSALHFVAG